MKARRQFVALKIDFVYLVYLYSGVMGSGVCVFTRGLILGTLIHRYSLNGYAYKIQHGDWFGGKVAGLCKVLLKGLMINLYATHIHAEYNVLMDEYLHHRVVQAFELAQFIRYTSAPSKLPIFEFGDGDNTTPGDWRHPINIVCGDFNLRPSDLGYSIIREVARLSDSWLCFDRRFDVESGGEDTSESADNIYTSKSLVRKYGTGCGKRIDYVMFGEPLDYHHDDHGSTSVYKIACVDAGTNMRIFTVRECIKA